MQNVASSLSNPFGVDPGCERFVPGYGDANAHFHVIGDHPGVHGGIESGIPFTETPGAERLQRALAEAGLLEATGTPPEVGRTFLSYVHPCVPEGVPTRDDYADMDPMFDAELRAITAHVLLPVGERAMATVFARCTTEDPDSIDEHARHATEVRGAGWLVYPVADPATWTDEEERALIEALQALLATDYEREADLGRFLPGAEPYRVR